VMKMLVHHDLRAQIEACPQELPPDAAQPPFAGDVALVKELGAQFCDKGVLSKDLLPWLWRNLSFSLLDRPEEVDFLLALLTRLGLLTTLTNQESPVWLLPMRLPVKDINLSAATSMAKTKFSAFMARAGDAALLDGVQHVEVSSLSQALSFIVKSQLVPQHVLDAACAAAFAAADLMLSQAPNPHGLTRDDIAAIHLYTQENPIYGVLNAALRNAQRASVKPYWGFIKLLQMALFKLPKESTNTALHRGIRIRWGPEGHTGEVSLEDRQAALAELEAELRLKQGTSQPEIWWGFSSTSTSLDAV